MTIIGVMLAFIGKAVWCSGTFFSERAWFFAITTNYRQKERGKKFERDFPRWGKSRVPTNHTALPNRR
jgi:hypothetical protein